MKIKIKMMMEKRKMRKWKMWLIYLNRIWILKMRKRCRRLNRDRRIQWARIWVRRIMRKVVSHSRMSRCKEVRLIKVRIPSWGHFGIGKG